MSAAHQDVRLPKVLCMSSDLVVACRFDGCHAGINSYFGEAKSMKVRAAGCRGRAKPAPHEERCNRRDKCSLRRRSRMGVRHSETTVLLKRSSRLAVKPPVEPMLAKLADELPVGAYLYEPKWDGFRAIVFRGEDELYLQSRDARPLDRYFPELHDALLEVLPQNCVLDGEIVIATPRGLDFDALQLRLHPAASR